MASFEIEPIGNDTYRVTVLLTGEEMSNFRLAHIKSTGLNPSALPILQVGFIDGRIDLDESGIPHKAAVERRLFADYLEKNPAFIDEIMRRSAEPDVGPPPAV